MSNFEQQSCHRRQKRQTKRSPLVLLLVIVLWSIGLGWGMALAIDSPSDFWFSPESLNPKSKIPLRQQGRAASAGAKPSLNPKSIDSVPDRYQVGQELYLESCSSCHVPIPPEVMPTETWKQLLEKPQKHYGKQLPQFIGISRILIWDYLRTYSRSVAIDEPIPLYVEQSRYFKALHPRVDLPKPTTHQSCVSCHLGAKNLDYRSLTPEWENSP
ncbi:MAG: cytochrome [Xenococcaceae cyanobacterium]